MEKKMAQTFYWLHLVVGGLAVVLLPLHLIFRMDTPLEGIRLGDIVILTAWVILCAKGPPAPPPT